MVPKMTMFSYTAPIYGYYTVSH